VKTRTNPGGGEGKKAREKVRVCHQRKTAQDAQAMAKQNLQGPSETDTKNAGKMPLPGGNGKNKIMKFDFGSGGGEDLALHM